MVTVSEDKCKRVNASTARKRVKIETLTDYNYFEDDKIRVLKLKIVEIL